MLSPLEQLLPLDIAITCAAASRIKLRLAPRWVNGAAARCNQRTARSMGVGYFSPWRGSEARACATCTHSIGYDGTHLWCQKHQLVVVYPCGWWERGAGCDGD